MSSRTYFVYFDAFNGHIPGCLWGSYTSEVQALFYQQDLEYNYGVASYIVEVITRA